MKAAAVQLNSTADFGANLAAADRLTRAAAADGAQLIVLPEKWTAMGSDEQLRAAAEPLDGRAVSWARDIAAELGVDLVAGSFLERIPGEDRFANTCVHVSPSGGVRAVYRKLHMFDVCIDGRSYRESDIELPGEEIVLSETSTGVSGEAAAGVSGEAAIGVSGEAAIGVSGEAAIGVSGEAAAGVPVETPAGMGGAPGASGGGSGSEPGGGGGSGSGAAAGPGAAAPPGVELGLAICYDLRFPELLRILAVRGARILALPSAFTLPTTRDHWEVLVRARAIENQMFVIAANQFGLHPGGARSGGRSMIVDPWGVVLAQASDGERHIVAELDLARQAEIRAQLPALANRRPEAYSW